MLDLNPPYTVEVAAEPYPGWVHYSIVPKVQGKKRKHEGVVCFLDSMGADANDTDPCIRNSQNL